MSYTAGTLDDAGSSTFDGEVADEAGTVCAVHEPEHLEELTVLVKAGVQDFEDGHAGWQVEGLGFLVVGHPGKISLVRWS